MYVRKCEKVYLMKCAVWQQLEGYRKQNMTAATFGILNHICRCRKFFGSIMSIEDYSSLLVSLSRVLSTERTIYSLLEAFKKE